MRKALQEGEMHEDEAPQQLFCSPPWGWTAMAPNRSLKMSSKVAKGDFDA
jgi:hypothetical protein